MSKSEAEETLALHIDALGLPRPEREYQFHPTRKWRFDFAWPDSNLAVEVEGGVWTAGRHTRGSGFVADLDKYNQATLLGWMVLRFSTAMVESGDALDMIEAVLMPKRLLTWHNPYSMMLYGDARASVALDHDADGRSVTQHHAEPCECCDGEVLVLSEEDGDE